MNLDAFPDGVEAMLTTMQIMSAAEVVAFVADCCCRISRPGRARCS